MLKNMTAGDPLKLLVAFAIPLLIGNIFQQFYNMADAMIVGNTLGVKAFAAVGSVGSVMFLVFGGFFGLCGGLTVITAQRFGASDDAGVRRSIATSIYIALFATALITILCTSFAQPIIRAMNTPEEILPETVAFFYLISLGTIGGAIYNLVSNILRALGDSRTPLLFIIASTVINVILDLVFILVFHTGIGGVAWATNIAMLLSGIGCICYAYPRYQLLHLRGADWRWDWRAIGKHLAIAIPMALQFSITAIGSVVLQQALNGLGTTSIAAFSAAWRVDSLAIMPLFSLGMAMATYAAQNYGARNYVRIVQGVRTCDWLVMAICLFSSFFMAVAGKWSVGIFVRGEDSAQVLNLASIFLLTQATFYPILGLIFTYRNVLQGIGRTLVPMLAGAAEMVARCAAAFLLVPALGFWGGCVSNPLAWLAADVLLLPMYWWLIKTKEFRQGTPGSSGAG